MSQMLQRNVSGIFCNIYICTYACKAVLLQRNSKKQTLK